MIVDAFDFGVDGDGGDGGAFECEALEPGHDVGCAVFFECVGNCDTSLKGIENRRVVGRD